VGRVCRMSAVILILCCLLAAAGCSRQSEPADRNTYDVYYIKSDGVTLDSYTYEPVSEDFDGILGELLEELSSGTPPEGSAAIPSDVTVNGYEKNVDTINVDFSGAYLGLTNIREILLRTSLVRTLVQMAGVVSISVTIDGQPLTETDGTVVGAMSADTFIVSQGSGINSYQSNTFTLYFPDDTGELIVPETRLVYYSSNLITEQVVCEQIISGTVDDRAKHKYAVSPDTKINSVTITDRICLVDLSSKFNESYDAQVSPEAALQCFVQSICALGQCDGVRFMVEGSSDVRFRGEISLDTVFTPDSAIVTTVRAQEDSAFQGGGRTADEEGEQVTEATAEG